MQTIYHVSISRSVEGPPPYAKHFESKKLADAYFRTMKILLPNRCVFRATSEYYGGESL